MDKDMDMDMEGGRRRRTKVTFKKLPLQATTCSHGTKDRVKWPSPPFLRQTSVSATLEYVPSTLRNTPDQPLDSISSKMRKSGSPFEDALGELKGKLEGCANKLLNAATAVKSRLDGSRMAGPLWAGRSPLLCSTSLALAGQGGHESESQNEHSGDADILRESNVVGDEREQSARPAVIPAHRTSASMPRSRRKGQGIMLTDDREEEERVLISEILIKDKDGNDIDDPKLLSIVQKALKQTKPNLALTIKEVQEDVLRIIDTGYFSSCLPTAEDTRDGVRLVFRVDPNMEMTGLKVIGANVLPTRVVEDAFRSEYGKVVNLHRLEKGLDTLNMWFNARGLFGQVTDVEIKEDGVVQIQVAEAEVNKITVRFRDRKTGEPSTGKTRPETLLRQLMTKPGQVYSLQQGKRDAETVLTMGIMEDVNLVPQPADTGMVDLTMNVVERKAGGFSAGGGFSGNSLANGPLSALIGSFAYSNRNAFGRNQKLNVSLERGQFDSMFRVNYTDPWIEGDEHRTLRAINIQNSRSPGTTVHGVRREGAGPWHGGVTIGRLVAGVDWSRPLRPKLSGTAGLSYQRAGARDDHGQPKLVDIYGSPLTYSGRSCDNMLVAKLEAVYTDSGDQGSSMVVVNTEQGLPIQPDWLFFNRVLVRARQGVRLGPLRCIASFSGGTHVGDLSPHEAFPIGGTNSVRGYDEGAVGSGRSYVVTSGEISLPLVGLIEGAIFGDYGSDLGSGATVPGDPAGARGKPGNGYGYGAGIRVDSPLGPLRLEMAYNDKGSRRFHFGIGYRN